MTQAGGRSSRGLDLLRVPVLGAFLERRWARTALQLPLLALAAALVLHGLLGPDLAPKNLATLLTWVHYRGLLVVALLALGNVFCLGCPLLIPREIARRLGTHRWRFPRVLRRKWIAVALFAGILYAYELFDLWGDPAWTAGLILLYFAAALVVDALFERASFCKFLCPIGQFSFVASTLSPFEVRVREASACKACRTKDCIRGRRDGAGVVHQRGCELNLYLPRKVGNLDCTFCLDCVHACPHDNVAIAARLPGEELAVDPVRSGIGRLSRRRDVAALFVLFTFGALLNAFGMVSPVYDFQRWLAGVLGTRSEDVTLTALFVLGLVVAPVVLLGAAGGTALRAAGSRERLLGHAVRFSAALVPMGLGVWAAHYSFHLLTGLWTFVPVVQSAARSVGLDLGAPDWGRGGLAVSAVQPIETGLLCLGLAGSLAIALRLARRDFPAAPRRAFAPWAALLVALFASAVWLLRQPMELRGTFL